MLNTLFTIIIYYIVGFAFCLLGAAVMWREKVRSWLSGLIGGTLAQLLGTRLADVHMEHGLLLTLPVQHDLAAPAISTILGIASAVAIIVTLLYASKKRRGRQDEMPAE